jgi:hypothetical protein
MTRKSLIAIAVLLCLAGGTAAAVDLGEALVKTVTVGAVVNAVSGPADDALNTMLANRHLPPGVETKVVPVLSVGEKGYVGAVQVAGSKTLVSKTKAVLQLETSWSNKQYRIKLFMPVDSVNPLSAGRVRGLGVSALIDTALSHNAYLVPASRGFGTGDLLRAGAIAVATKEFAPQINSFVNSVFRNEGATLAGATKVVPYLSVGEKAYIGMMQVAGPKAAVDRVKAVWQYEDLFDRGRVRLRALVPSDSINPLKITRVKGVGCTAIIDAMALRAREAERQRDQYRYFERSALFVGLGEDPHYRPPGWDRGRKTGWAKHGDPYHPPGLSKKMGPRGMVIVVEEEKDKPAPPAKGKGKKK